MGSEYRPRFGPANQPTVNPVVEELRVLKSTIEELVVAVSRMVMEQQLRPNTPDVIEIPGVARDATLADVADALRNFDVTIPPVPPLPPFPTEMDVHVRNQVELGQDTVDRLRDVLAALEANTKTGARILTARNPSLKLASGTVDNDNPVPVMFTAGASLPLTTRMRNNQVTENYRMWNDTADDDHIYVAEAPVNSDPAADAVWRGIRFTKDADGNPLGVVEEAANFVWDDRTSASWS